MNIIGEVEGKNCVMIDDMVDTAGTLCHAAGALKEHGAVTRGVPTSPIRCCPGRPCRRIAESSLDEMVVTDTIPLNAEARACSKIRQLSTAELLAETMRRISDEESVSARCTSTDGTYRRAVPVSAREDCVACPPPSNGGRRTVKMRALARVGRDPRVFNS